MALPRKDCRVYFDDEIYQALKAVVTVEGSEPAAWIESVIADIVRKRVLQANLMVSSLQESGALRAITDKHG